MVSVLTENVYEANLHSLLQPFVNNFLMQVYALIQGVLLLFECVSSKQNPPTRILLGSTLLVAHVVKRHELVRLPECQLRIMNQITSEIVWTQSVTCAFNFLFGSYSEAWGKIAQLIVASARIRSKNCFWLLKEHLPAVCPN